MRKRGNYDDNYGEFSEDNLDMLKFGIKAHVAGGEDFFPMDDATDMGRGARFIPSEVTVARRRREQVVFVNECGPCCWYWQFASGNRIYHWERWVYEQVAQANGKVKNEEGNYPDGSGPCPRCGNIHMRGGVVTPKTMEDW